VEHLVHDDEVVEKYRFWVREFFTHRVDRTEIMVDIVFVTRNVDQRPLGVMA
jgi:hypothetical protein